MTTNPSSIARLSIPSLDPMAEVLVHPGKVDPLRIAAVRCSASALQITVPHEQPLDEIVRRVLREQGWSSAVGQLESGVLRSFSFSHPIPGPDETSRVALSPASLVEHAAIVHGGLTVGSRKGEPLVHTHAVFVNAAGERRGGHLHYDSVVMGAGTIVHLWGTSDTNIVSSFDQEIGVPIFQFGDNRRMVAETLNGSGNAVFARIRPNVDLSYALEAVLKHAGFEGKLLVPGQIGSLVGTTFSDPNGLRRIAGPVVEVLKLTPLIRRDGKEWHVDLEAEIVDSQGRLHSGVLARGLNPVCMTFELGVFEQGSRHLTAIRA